MASDASDDLLPGDGPFFRKAERKKHKALRTEVAELRSLIEDYRAATDATRRDTLLWIQEGFETLRKQPLSALQDPRTNLGYSRTSSIHSIAVAPLPTTSTIEDSVEWTSGLAQQHRMSSQKWKPTTPNTRPRSQEIATPKSAHRQEGSTNKSPLRSNRKGSKKMKQRSETRSCIGKQDTNVESATGKTPTHHRARTMARVLHDAPRGTLSTPQQGVEILPQGHSKQPGSRDRQDSVESHPPNNPCHAEKNAKKRSHVDSRPTVSKNNFSRAQKLPTTDRMKGSASESLKSAKRHPVSSTAAAKQSRRKYPKEYHTTKVPQTRVWNTASHYREVSMPLRDARTAQCTCSELPDHFLEAEPSGPNFGAWTGGLGEYLCHSEQILSCRGHSDLMRRNCREFYETEWPRFERQQCARAKEAAARRQQTKGSMSNAELEAITGESHDFLADHRVEKEQPEAQSDRPVARQHSTVPPSLFFHGIPPRSNFRIPPGFPHATLPEPVSAILNLDPLTDCPSPAVLPGQSYRSHESIPTTSPTDPSADDVIRANNEHGHSDFSSTESCSLKATSFVSTPVKSATAQNKSPSLARSAEKVKKRKKQQSTASEQSPKRLRHRSHSDSVALESEPRAAQASCCDDDGTLGGRGLDNSRDQEPTTLGGGRCSQIDRDRDDDWGAMGFFDEDEMFPNGPPSPVRNASNPRAFAANAFMSGALTDCEAVTGADPSTPTSISRNGTMHQASEATNGPTALPTQHRQGWHIRFDGLSTPERRDRSIYRRYGTEPVLSASQLSPADAVRRQVSNIGQVFHLATATGMSLQPGPSESRSHAISAPVVGTGTGTTNAINAAQPRQPKQSLEERKRRLPPILPPYVGESERLSDKILIKIGTFRRPYERHLSAPYAYCYSSGKLTSDYLYLAELKNPD
ncbi:MAG: hypothetical protein Q9228_002014, partial [Teloschistes exilis]